MSITIDLENKKIKIEDSVINLMNSYKQVHEEDCEAGGILIGRENIDTGNVIIEYATEPCKKDKRERNYFHRKDKKHIEVYNNLYKKHNSIYAYIGEWHTHPEDYPTYSYIDINNWRRITRINSDKKKIYYHVIVGNKDLRIWEYNVKQIKRVY
ncbi:Mov34/MPN/PAD-1 family protein [Clostridium sporogenes]|uniref:Mov34/MPN/PAD-1 family protein n=1 Tax=Clostridium sporogenes TaxID=1509 RepID=UPI0006B25CC1|nr:Mov34/MPN/PAD-1 family protein [Clostridium sporogenes]KOY65396.1 hypothetical protein AN649_13020 [Clostridium sporogenes]MDS1006675.1 Mov34/MPN/PAD-1 family protein [Clostridium sporogenes]